MAANASIQVTGVPSSALARLYGPDADGELDLSNVAVETGDAVHAIEPGWLEAPWLCGNWLGNTAWAGWLDSDWLEGPWLATELPISMTLQRDAPAGVVPVGAIAVNRLGGESALVSLNILVLSGAATVAAAEIVRGDCLGVTIEEYPLG